MKELIEITEREGQKVVSAKELYEVLEISQDYGTWIKNRLKQFDQGVDYQTLQSHSRKVMGRPSTTNYALTMETAKHIALVANTSKGKQVRRYFIEAEMQWRQVVNAAPATPALPGTFAEALRVLLAEVEAKEQLQLVNQQQHQQLVEAEPKLSAYDCFINSSTNLQINGASKLLNYQDLGEKKLFAYLRAAGILNFRNVPYQPYINRGFFTIKASTYERNGSIITNTTTYITPAGMVYLKRKLDKAGYQPRRGGQHPPKTNFLPL